MTVFLGGHDGLSRLWGYGVYQRDLGPVDAGDTRQAPPRVHPGCRERERQVEEFGHRHRGGSQVPWVDGGED